MKFSELRTVMQPEDRVIFRLFSTGDKTIDSGAVVLMNLGDALNDAQVLLVYTQNCIQHVDLKIPAQQMTGTDWQQVFGKQVFENQSPNFAPTNYEQM